MIACSAGALPVANPAAAQRGPTGETKEQKYKAEPANYKWEDENIQLG
jgi:hypothetical protein